MLFLQPSSVSLRNRLECRTCRNYQNRFIFSYVNFNTEQSRSIQSPKFCLRLVSENWNLVDCWRLWNFIITNFGLGISPFREWKLNVSFVQKVLKHNGKQVSTWVFKETAHVAASVEEKPLVSLNMINERGRCFRIKCVTLSSLAPRAKLSNILNSMFTKCSTYSWFLSHVFFSIAFRSVVWLRF